MTRPRTTELLDMSRGLYITITGLTESPAEAITILSMIHLTLFLNHGDPTSSVDAMLSDYTTNFKKNWEANKAQAS